MKTLTWLVMAGLLACTCSTGRGQDGEWQFEVTPYAWFAGLEGDVTIRDNGADLDRSFTDLSDAVEVAASLRIVAERNRIVAGVLVDHFSTDTDELNIEDQPLGGTLQSTMLLSEGIIGYKVDGWTKGHTFVLAVGVRNLHAESDLIMPGVGEFSLDSNITDGMFYVLPRIPLFPARIRGLCFNPVLGIGAGDSDLTYELFPQVQYQLTDAIAARMGYRTAGWHFTDDRHNKMNVNLAGMTLGLGWIY